VVDANRLGSHAGSSDARPTPWSPRPRRATGETDPRDGAPANLRRRRSCHGHCLAHPGAGTPRGGNDTPKAREIGYSAASPRSCVWWRYCGRHRGRSDRRDRRWSARGDRRRHRRCCPWRYCRREDCRGCAAWRPEPGEAVHLRRLKRALRAEIDESAWSSLYSTVSRPFPRPTTGRIAVKVINHYGDEVLKVYALARVAGI
jgi:hypothetical protein